MNAELLKNYIERAIRFVSETDGIDLRYGEELRAVGDDRTALLRLAGRLQARANEIEAYTDQEAPTL